MLRAAITFFVLALIAFVLGFYNLAGLSMDVGRMLLGVFLVLGVITLLISLLSGRSPKLPN